MNFPKSEKVPTVNAENITRNTFQQTVRTDKNSRNDNNWSRLPKEDGSAKERTLWDKRRRHETDIKCHACSYVKGALLYINATMLINQPFHCRLPFSWKRSRSWISHAEPLILSSSMRAMSVIWVRASTSPAADSDALDCISERKSAFWLTITWVLKIWPAMSETAEMAWLWSTSSIYPQPGKQDPPVSSCWTHRQCPANETGSRSVSLWINGKERRKRL